MEHEYLSVKQFAKRAGVTTQRIYQLMNKSLKIYCKTENGKKYISAEGLKIFEKSEIEKDNLQELAKDLPRPKFRSYNSLKSNLQEETIHVLQKQLAIKDKQIDEKDKQIAELTTMLKISQEQQVALVQALTAAQALAAADKQQLLLQAGQATEQSEHSDPTENIKKGFFRRIFSK